MIMDMNLLLDVLLVVLLTATVIYCFMLNRRLGQLRNAQGDMAALVQSFDQSTERARSSIDELKNTAGAVGMELEARVAKARSMLDELQRVTTSGERVADRIEKGVDSRKASATAAPAARSAEQAADGKPARTEREGRGDAESKLLKALRQVR
ncbi:MAG: DUF6468 domain-containing protein [Minwuia sp.]|nr:DUF6468 domain-containing protein [Minwuia sp.]